MSVDQVHSAEQGAAGAVSPGVAPAPSWQTHAFRLAFALDSTLHSKGSPVLINIHMDHAERVLNEFWKAYSTEFEESLPCRFLTCEVCAVPDQWCREVKVADTQISDVLWACPGCQPVDV